MTSSDSPLLEVKKLNVFFRLKQKELHAVKDLSFSLFQGETLGIVGESGCGKSATAKALLKLLPSHSSRMTGEIWYEKENLMAYSEDSMQKIRGKEIGMIFQDPMTSLNPTLKVGSQIVEGYCYHHTALSGKAKVAYAIEMLEKVGIPNPSLRIEDYPHLLSGGMRQRVMIALALCSKPKLLIADEPTTALDVTIQAQILDLMKTVQEKKSMILITHDLSVVAGFCDRVLVMYGGKIVEDAPVERLFSHPNHPYTKRLLQAIPRLDMGQEEPLVPIEGSPPDLALKQKGCSFCPRCPSAMNICSELDPALFTIAPSHQSACFLNDPRRYS